jgi:toxin CcdB
MAQLNRYRRRVVVTLVRLSAMPASMSTVGSRMNPVFHIGSKDLVLHPLDMVSMALNQLGEHAGSLAEHGQQIADALDELLTRSWG